jgi:hypothetical protein
LKTCEKGPGEKGLESNLQKALLGADSKKFEDAPPAAYCSASINLLMDSENQNSVFLGGGFRQFPSSSYENPSLR